MLEYHAAFYLQPSGWYVVSVLDFPGVNTQGKNLRSARFMVKDALKLMAECCLESGKPLPSPNPRAKDKKADHIERIRLSVRVQALAAT
jgi:predicted RNase H-like HicB family nuclease